MRSMNHVVSTVFQHSLKTLGYSCLDPFSAPKEERTGMTGYAIIRVEKHTTLGTVAAAGHHLDRTRTTPNADAKKAHLNRTWSGCEWVPWGDATREPGAHLAAVRARLKDFQARGGKVQKNAVIALEAIMTASPEAFKAPDFDFEGWLSAQTDYLATTFGKQNIASVVLHLDEETPHVHALVVPELQRLEKRGKKPADPSKPRPAKLKPVLSASHWVDGRAKLAALQTDYASAMSRFGLQRGKERSGARHVPVGEYYARGAALVAQIEQLQAEVERLKPAAERLPAVERQLTEAHALIDSLQASRAEQRARIDRMRAARKADAADLDAIKAVKAAMPATYARIMQIAAEHEAACAAALLASLQEPDTPTPGLS